jgi:cell division control protein 6
MTLFKDILGSEESLFMNEFALDYEFVPKLLPYREAQQRYIATCIKPLLQERNGRNLLIYGAPGIGKTAATKWVFRDLEEETEDVIPVYINCWQKNTTYKIILEICDILGYKFTQNKKTDELFEVVQSMLNKKSAVFAFDEADKLEDFDFLYTILEKIYRKSIFLITNHKECLLELDDRIKSRLNLEALEFKPYNYNETEGILKQRLEYAFVPNVWDDDAFNLVVRKTAELKDIRKGLYLMKESGLAAEDVSSKKINAEHVHKAVAKLDDFSIKKSTDLEEDTQLVLETVKENSGKKIGDLYKLYRKEGGKGTYKTFQRKINKLEKNKFISVTKTAGGKEGNTSIINYHEEKKLTDF